MPNRTCLLFVFLALQLRMEAATAALIAIFLTLEFRLLAIQFNWVSRPQHGFVVNAAAGIVVLLFTMLLLNGGAIYLRNRLQKKGTA